VSHNISTGISGLDKLIGGLRPGDSVFWCVDEVRSYWKFAARFADACRQCRRGVVCISWHPEECRRAARVECDSSFCFDPTKGIEEQLDAFLDFASVHGNDCFVVGIPPAKKQESYEEPKLMRFLGKVFAQLFWLDSISYFGFLDSQFGSDSLTILHDIPRVLVRSNLKGDLNTLRILKAPGRALVDTHVVYALGGDELTPVRPGEPSPYDFQRIVEREENVAWVLGLNNEVVYVSRGALGFSREKLRTDAPALLRELPASASVSTILSRISESKKTGRAVSGIETAHTNRATGDTEYFVHNIIPLRDKEGRTYGFLGTSTNVTELREREELLKNSEAEQRRLAEQLSESERKYRNLFNNAADVISIIDREGRLVDVNPACCQLTGYSRDELLKMTCADLVDHFDKDRFMSLFKGGSIPWSVRTEYSFIRKDGTQVPLEVSAVMLDPNHALFVSRDVTERNIVDAKLKASEEKFRSLVRQAGLGITYMNVDGDYLDVNDAFCRMTGYSREEQLAAKGARPHWPEEYVSRHRDYVGRAVSGNTDVVETVFKRKSGELFPVRIHPSPVTDHTGERVGAIGLIEDITAWKELQQQVIHSQRMEVASFLAVGIAHEFNNLHGGIQNHVELILENEKLPPEVYKDLEVILKTLRRANSITKQLDTFARATPLHKEPCSLSEVIGDTLELVSREYESEGIKIEAQSGQGIPELVIDGAQIGQVLLNLFINARDAMRGSKLKVLRVETGLRGRLAFVKVSDTGRGIVSENATRIFEPFFTTKGDEDGKGAHGLGLGLTVSKAIVREHDGNIEVSSKVGVGTAFTIWLPVESRGRGASARNKRRTRRDGRA
jgi:PAS domain S-box-containing protein